MKRAFASLVWWSCHLELSQPVRARDTHRNRCEWLQTEIETYCKAVTPGEGRILACLYAYQDKLSGKCEYALYNAAVRLERQWPL